MPLLRSVNWLKTFSQKKLVLISLVLSVFLASVSFFAFTYTYRQPISDLQPRSIFIPKGTSLFKIAQILKAQKVIDHSWVFIGVAYGKSVHTSLKPGEYLFPSPRNLRTVFELLEGGKTVQRKFTAIEGHTVAEVISELNKREGLEGKIQILPPEGTLYPDTYYFSYGDQRQSVVDRMMKAQLNRLESLWHTRDRDLLISSPEEMVILASIVEKETGLSAERPRVAGLFYNRLRLKMRLQSDPTVLYGLHKKEGLALNRDLSKKELEILTPFNTYLQEGLPPTPICNPSLAALEAVVHPEKTDALYFVADGTGGHTFSPTYAQHQIHHQALRVRRLKGMK